MLVVDGSLALLADATSLGRKAIIWSRISVQALTKSGDPKTELGTSENLKFRYPGLNAG